MYKESRGKVAKDIIKAVAILIFITIIIPMFFAIIFGGLNSKINPSKCVTDYDGQSFCKTGDGDWIPQ